MQIQAILYNTENEALAASEGYYTKPVGHNPDTDTLYMFLVIQHENKWAMCIDDTALLTPTDFNKLETIEIEINGI